MSKMLKYNEDALKAVLKGVKTLSKAVKVTLGPRGRNVVMKKEHGIPISTKDGVMVAKEISLKDKFENMGVQLVKEAALKTSDVAGDGTTTAIVLAEAIISEGVKNVIAGANPMELKKGIDKAVKAMCDQLNAMAKPVKTSSEISQIASISANNDEEIGAIICDAMEKVGKDGIVTIGEARGIETILDVVEGMQFDKGYLSPYFVNNPEKMSVELDNPYILVTDKKISLAKEIIPLLEKVVEAGSRPLLVIAEDIEGEALTTLVVNKVQAGLSLCAVKAPGFGDSKKEMLADIAIICGATLISEEVGLKIEDANIELLGSAKKVKVQKNETTLVDGKGEMGEIKKRATQIKKQLSLASSNYDREKLEERLAKISGGVAVINIGAATESEMKEKKARVEDALHATRAALAEGVIPGGGVALLRCLPVLEGVKAFGDELIGVEIVKKASLFPIIAIAHNCGREGNLVAKKVEEGKDDFGYNGLKDDFAHLIEDGVLDPARVTKSAFKNAASVASMLLTISVMITDKPKSKKVAAPQMDMDEMGMI